MKFFSKSILKKTDSSLTVIIVIGLLIVLNFFSYQIFYRWDLTENRDYSISEASKRTAGELDDVVNIKVYFSQNLPSQFINLEQEVGDILDEYLNYSNNKIRVEFINPEELEEQDLYMLGIPALQFNVLEKDKYQVVKGYLGMVVEYGDKKEVIPVVEDTANLEYQVTLAIKKVISQEIAVIGVVTSNGGLSLDNEISLAYKKLQELYQVERVDLATTGQVAADIDTLILVGSKEEFSEDQFKAIDSFLMRGGSLLMLIDGVRVEEGLMALPNNINLGNLLESYGLKLNYDLVLDVSSGMASFSSGFITFSINYPLWPKIIKSGFDQNLAAVADLESLVLPWASSVEIIPAKQDEANQVYNLVRTTNQAWRQTENYNLNPQQRFLPEGDIGPYTLAAAVFGKLTSAYNQSQTEIGKIIVVGDSDFIKDRFLEQSPDNLIFFQNLVDSLSLDEALINIRSKGVSSRPIRELSAGQKALARYLNVFGVTIIIVLFGLIRYYTRRRSRFADEI